MNVFAEFENWFRPAEENDLRSPEVLDGVSNLSRLEGPESLEQAGSLENGEGDIPSFRDAFGDVELRTDIPGVDRALIFGNPFELAENLSFTQGNNELGFHGDCGLASIANLGVMAGKELSENDVALLADREGLCANEFFLPAEIRGGVDDGDILALMSRLDMPAHVESASEAGGSPEAIASQVETGHLVTIGLNAGLFWNDPAYVDLGQANHQVCITGVCRDADTGKLAGFFICDTGRGLPEDANRFVSTELLEEAYCGASDASAVITDRIYT